MTFFDPLSTTARAEEMRRIWRCTSHAEVLRLTEMASPAPERDLEEDYIFAEEMSFLWNIGVP